MRESAKIENSGTTVKKSDSTSRHNMNKRMESYSCGSCGASRRLSNPRLSSGDLADNDLKQVRTTVFPWMVDSED